MCIVKCTQPFINKNYIHTNQFSTLLSINRLPHPIKSDSYHPTIFIIIQLMKKNKRVFYGAHNTKNSNKSKNKNTRIFLKKMLVK